MRSKFLKFLCVFLCLFFQHWSVDKLQGILATWGDPQWWLVRGRGWRAYRRMEVTCVMGLWWPWTQCWATPTASQGQLKFGQTMIQFILWGLSKWHDFPSTTVVFTSSWHWWHCASVKCWLVDKWARTGRDKETVEFTKRGTRKSLKIWKKCSIKGTDSGCSGYYSLF